MVGFIEDLKSGFSAGEKAVKKQRGKNKKNKPREVNQKAFSAGKKIGVFVEKTRPAGKTVMKAGTTLAKGARYAGEKIREHDAELARQEAQVKANKSSRQPLYRDHPGIPGREVKANKSSRQPRKPAINVFDFWL